MKSYTIYDNTGKIIQSGTCEESDFHLLIDSFPEKYIIQQKVILKWILLMLQTEL